MLDMLEGLRAWQLLIIAVVVYGFLPGVVLRFIVLAFRRDDPRRAEILAERHAVPRWDQPFWVADQAQRALFEGLLERIKSRWRLLTIEPVTIEEAWEKGKFIPFTRDFEHHTFFSDKTIPQGKKALIARPHRGSIGQITHVDVRLADGERVREVPIDYLTV